MSQSKNNLNEEWRKIFGKAEETPPPGVWDAIEKRLDERSRVPLLLPWWEKPQAWLAAASLLLALGIGTVLFLQNGPDRASLTVGEKTQPGPQPDDMGQEAPEQEAPQFSVADLPAAPDRTANAKSAVPEAPEKAAVAAIASVEKPAASAEGSITPPQSAGGVAGETMAFRAKKVTAAAGADSRVDNRSIAGESVSGEEIASSLDLIEPRSFQDIKTYWQTRYVFFNPYADKVTEEPPAKPEASPLWAGIGLMPGAYNPNMQFSHQSVYQMNNVLTTTSTVDQYNSLNGATNRGSTGNRDQAKVSYQAFAQVGLNLSKRWSVESGVAFLQGNSTSRSPGFFMDRTTQESADLLPNAMASGNANYSDETFQKLQLSQGGGSYSAVYVPMDKNLDNRYSYLQVPAYVGYTFRPEKKFSYTLLGGGVTNLFLKNELETASGYKLETRPENNVYNNLSVSAAAGVRVSYRLNKAWNSSLTANYQRALMTSFKDNLFLKSYPSVYGVSWGVRYTFQR